MRYIIEDDWLVVDNSKMSLTKDEIDLIKVSWRPVLEDPRSSGISLFKELFTKFPEYSKLFPKFADLDVNELETSKILVAHASKVINTITAVINLLGDEAKSEILSEALQSTAKSHIRRHIGVDKFKNLGIVLIDFMCQINHRYQGELKQRQQRLERQKFYRHNEDLITTTGKTAIANAPIDCNTTNNIQDSVNEEGYLTFDSDDNENNNLDEKQPGSHSLSHSNGSMMMMDDLRQKMNSTSLEDEHDDGVDVCLDHRHHDGNQDMNYSRHSNRNSNNNNNNNKNYKDHQYNITNTSC